MRLLLGVDAGGTASRAALTTLDGTAVGAGNAGPGNPSAQGVQAAKAIGSAVREALGDHDPAAVSAAVVGVAGISGLTNPAVHCGERGSRSCPAGVHAQQQLHEGIEA